MVVEVLDEKEKREKGKKKKASAASKEEEEEEREEESNAFPIKPSGSYQLGLSVDASSRNIVARSAAYARC